MKIIYDYKNSMYQIIMEYPETELNINTSNIFEARKYFIDSMTELFDYTVGIQFKKEI